MNNKGLVVASVILGLAFFYVSFVYATHSAGSLPSSFPGYLIGDSHVHSKHSIASGIVGVACLVFAWFKSGPTTAK